MLYNRIVYIPLQRILKVYIAEIAYRIPSRIGKRVIPYSRGSHKEINILTPRQYLYSAQYNIYIKTLVNINRQRTVAIIDSRATRNFIS